jgi:hypothetical protein
VKDLVIYFCVHTYVAHLCCQQRPHASDITRRPRFMMPVHFLWCLNTDIVPKGTSEFIARTASHPPAARMNVNPARAAAGAPARDGFVARTLPTCALSECELHSGWRDLFCRRDTAVV